MPGDLIRQLNKLRRGIRSPAQGYRLLGAAVLARAVKDLSGAWDGYPGRDPADFLRSEDASFWAGVAGCTREAFVQRACDAGQVPEPAFHTLLLFA